ncbi:MAG: tRNA adenosine(34) deaminase TadA [Proteobacteria bacterium]|nr:tRNA adenosine(34) deaminase TadA [Pseudomonadota bacterium]
MFQPITAHDEQLMRLALEAAQAAARAGEAPVGAVIADLASGDIVARAGNAPISGHDPTAHAEILALRAAAKALGNYRLNGLTLVVTLEPCAMCAGAISHARIGRLVYGASDPKGGAVEHGPRLFEQPTIHHRPLVTAGVLGLESAALLRGFFRERRQPKAASPARSPLIMD